jgi:hypothetical protein
MWTWMYQGCVYLVELMEEFDGIAGVNRIAAYMSCLVPSARSIIFKSNV